MSDFYGPVKWNPNFPNDWGWGRGDWLPFMAFFSSLKKHARNKSL